MSEVEETPVLTTKSLTLLLVTLYIGLATAAALQAQTVKVGPKRPAAAKVPGQSQQQDAGKTADSQPGTKPDTNQFGSSLVSAVVSSTTDQDDHVPCEFTLKELLSLRPVPGVIKLTDADESRVFTEVIQALSSSSETDLTQEQKAAFVAVLAGELNGRLAGKTPGEALATIMNSLYKITTKNRDLLDAAENKETLEQAVTARAQKYGGDSFSQTVERKLKEQPTGQQNPSWFKQNDPVSTLGFVATVVANAPEAGASSATKSAAQQTANDLNNASSVNNKVNGAVANSARSAIGKFVRPSDIGCAYQVLSWNDSRLLFGRSVANEFISIQVTIRNLNPKDEFLVHNAMLSVDTDIHKAIGRYFEGVDKIGVEAYNNAGESLTARGIVGNSISATSTLLSVLQPIVGITNFSNAVAAFTGGVVPGWKTLSPDHQKEQLLLIANNGFSASNNYKTVVPKSGSATFYTWIPAKPFLEGWWVQDCARKIVTVKDSPSDSPNAPQVGIDLDRAQKACVDQGIDGWKSVPYQKWSSTAEQLFRDLSAAVVAGIHIAAESQKNPTITDLKCPKNQQGELDLSNPGSDGSIACDITGENLDKITKLRLENAGNLVDPERPEGNVTVNGDNTVATVKFNVSDLAKATGAEYNVYSVSKDGSETATGQKIALSASPTITAIKPDAIDLAKVPDKLTITGYRLDKLTEVCVSPGSAANGQAAKVAINSPVEATMSTSLVKLTQGVWHFFLGDCAKQPDDSKKTITVTGNAPPTITSFNPTSAAIGQSITITGANLSGATAVAFGGVETSPSLAQDTKITVTVPNGAKSGGVGVTTQGGTATRDGFKILTPSHKTSKSPQASPPKR